MKTILKNTVIASAMCALMGMSSISMADENDELMLVITKPVITTVQSKGGLVAPTYQSIAVPRDGRTDDEIIAAMKRSGEYATVERDVVIRSIYPAGQQPVSSLGISAQNTETDPNDEFFYDQRSLFADNVKGETAGANIFGAWEALGADIDNEVTVVVLDSGFFSNDDVDYAVGLNHIDDDRTDPYDFQPSPDQEYCTSHGLGVASTIAAKTNNGVGAAGVASNVKIHAGRVMDCGTGRLSSAARGLDAYAFGRVAEHEGEPLIFNLSLGGAVSVCPQFMQSAIDRVVDKGWKVVVAAGNEGYEARRWTPANCDNVIVVGATDEYGVQSHFSNFGEEIDVSAQGEEVVAACRDNKSCYWGGTSFAAPIVAGVLALAEKAGGIDTDMVERVISGTAFSLDNQCPYGECGAGLINAKALVEVAQAKSRGELNSISHALADKKECDQQWYVDNFGNSARLCEMYKVTFMGGYANDTTSFKLYRSQPDNADPSTYEFVGEFGNSNTLMEDYSDEHEYKFQICENGECGTDWFDVNTEKAATPSVCS